MAGVPLTPAEQALASPVLTAMPPIAGLPSAMQAAVVGFLAGSAGRRYASGDQEPNLAGNLWFQSKGCTALRSTGHFHRVVRGPAVLSPVNVGFGGPEILVLQPDTVLHELPVSSALWFNAWHAGWAGGMLASVAADLEATRFAREATYAGMADYFESSGALVEGPYQSSQVRMVLVVVEDDPPPPLPWNVLPALPGSKRWIRAFTHYTNFKAPGAPSSYEYQELAQLIPCLTASGLGFHTGRMYPDGVMPTAVGRELYAFPKRCAEVWMDDKGGGAAFQGKFMFHAEWTTGSTQGVGDFVRGLCEALLPGWAGTLGVPQVTGLLAGAMAPALTRIGLPLRIFTERTGYSDSPVTPLGNDEMVRAPFRFVVKQPREVTLDWLYDVNRLTLNGLGAFEVEVDVKLHESYAVRDRTGWLRLLRNPVLAAQLPIRSVLELFQ